MKYCYYCGTGLDDAMNFCPRCGKKFNEGSDNPEAMDSFVSGEATFDAQEDVNKETEEHPDASQEHSGTVSTDSVEPSEAEYQRKKRNPWWIGIAAVLVIAVALCLAKAGIINIKGVTVDIPELAKSVLYLEIYDDKGIVGSASGFLIEDDTLVTNYHVIDGAYNIIAYTDNGEHSAEFSTVLSYDEDLDLAILSGKDDELGVEYFTLADSSLVKQGDKVYVVGYPLGLANTLSEGIVGAVYDSDEMTYIQTSAPISQGNSGGPVLNKKGEVIGVTSMYLDAGQNMNYSVSSNDAKSLLKDSLEVLLPEMFYGHTTSDIVSNSDNKTPSNNGSDNQSDKVQKITVSLNCDHIFLPLGASKQVVATTNPGNQYVTWSVAGSGSNVSVNNGTIKNDSTVLTYELVYATTSSGDSAFCIVYSDYVEPFTYKNDKRYYTAVPDLPTIKNIAHGYDLGLWVVYPREGATINDTYVSFTYSVHDVPTANKYVQEYADYLIAQGFIYDKTCYSDYSSVNQPNGLSIFLKSPDNTYSVGISTNRMYDDLNWDGHLWSMIDVTIWR